MCKPSGDGSVQIGDGASAGNITTNVTHGISLEKHEEIVKRVRADLGRAHTAEQEILRQQYSDDQSKKTDGTEFVLELLVDKVLTEKKAQDFEDFFAAIGNALWGGDFEPWKPQGVFGDYKCDGYRPNQKTVYQCNAPEHFSAATVVKKINDDFLGAVDNFGNAMQKWIFVHNQTQGLPARAGMKIVDLRAAHSGVKIEVWGPIELKRQLKDLSPQALSQLLGGIQTNLEFDSTAMDALKNLIQNDNAVTAPVETEVANGQNINEMEDALGDLGEDDLDIRRRILGYSLWLEPAEKDDVFKRLVDFGHDQDTVENNAQRLEDSSYLIITKNHYLPKNMEICQQAADSLLNEFMNELEAQ